MATAAPLARERLATILRWGGCLALVMAVHVGLALTWLHGKAVPDRPAQGPEAVLLELAPPSSRPEPAPDLPAPSAPPREAVPELPVPASAAPPSPASVKPTIDTLPTPLVPSPPIALPEPPPILLTPKPVETPPPVPVPEPRAPAITPPPPPNPSFPAPRVTPPAMARPTPPHISSRSPTARPSPALPPADSPQTPQAVATPPSAAQPAPSSPVPAASVAPGWRNELVGRLQRAKRYPDAARERNEQGVAAVTFVIDRAGHVLSAKLVRTSGSPSLDEEAVAMVRRADPLPPIPAELVGATLTLTVPVAFALR